jgi:hypothetical protein
MFSTRTIALFTTLLATLTGACSARDAQPAAAPAVAFECEGGTVRSEADAARYAGCESIVGDLSISGSSLTDVSAFRQVRSVSGKLVVTDNARLISLAGLKHVSSARAVEIRNNPMLAAYPGLLPALDQVDESVVVRSNRGISPAETRAVLDRIEVRSEQVTINTAQLGGQRVN